MSAILGEEAHPVPWIDRGQHGGPRHQLTRAQRRDGGEPNERERSEDLANPAGAATLDREQAYEDGDRQRHHHRLQRLGGNLQSLHRAEHGDGGRDHAVAVEERSAEEREQGDDRSPLAKALRDEREQRQDAARAFVVGSHDEREVLDDDDHHQRPEDERQNPEHVGRGDRDVVRILRAEALLECVERARADVAVDDADRTDHRADAGGVGMHAGVGGLGPGGGALDSTWLGH